MIYLDDDLEHFDLEKTTNQYINLYKSLLANN